MRNATRRFEGLKDAFVHASVDAEAENRIPSLAVGEGEPREGAPIPC